VYISKPSLSPGYNPYIALDSPAGRLALMDVGVLVLEPGQQFWLEEAEKEIAVLLLEGEATCSWGQESALTKRPNPFTHNAWCLHAPRGVRCGIVAHAHSELYVQKTLNEKVFEPRLHAPEDVHTQKAGAIGELGGMMRRNIRTIFDHASAPDSNMVLGEVINFPGRWSSYPPHHHPQPEVYFYRFSKPQGFGVGFANGTVCETRHNGLLLVTEGVHSQAAAPGYGLYYAWGIRHLPGNPWRKTRIDAPEHAWLLEKAPGIWTEQDEQEIP
jgi:5-deoxy-glucuronate isomerase